MFIRNKLQKGKNMFKKLAKCVREFKLPTILTLIFIVCEVVIEIFIPFVTADLITRIQTKVDMTEIISLGLLLILMAVLSLSCGGIAGFTCAKASAGFARNLREDIFGKIQTFSFENIEIACFCPIYRTFYFRYDSKQV